MRMNPFFVCSIFNIVTQTSSGILVLGGNFNCVTSPHQDRLWLKALRLGGVRFNNRNGPTVCLEKQISQSQKFYILYRHAYYSTLKVEEYKIDETEISPITISDHASLVLSWDLGRKPKVKQWRLNSSFFNDTESSDFPKGELKTYLDFNVASEASFVTLWDCAKAYP